MNPAEIQNLVGDGGTMAVLVWLVISLGKKLDVLATATNEMKNTLWRIENRKGPDTPGQEKT